MSEGAHIAHSNKSLCTSACFRLLIVFICLFLFTKISILIHTCCAFSSVYVCVSAACLGDFVCVRVCALSPFQVALTCSVHPTVRQKRTSQSLTACAPPPLSPLVLTLVFVSLLTRSLCGLSSVSEMMPVCRYNVYLCRAQTHVLSLNVSFTRP